LALWRFRRFSYWFFVGFCSPLGGGSVIDSFPGFPHSVSQNCFPFPFRYVVRLCSIPSFSFCFYELFLISSLHLLLPSFFLWGCCTTVARFFLQRRLEPFSSLGAPRTIFLATDSCAPRTRRGSFHYGGFLLPFWVLLLIRTSAFPPLLERRRYNRALNRFPLSCQR